MSKPRDPAWLEDARKAGPNGKTFNHLLAVPSLHEILAATGGSIMEDDTDTSRFTSGCAAYAGYTTGPFANMTAVRAYAASQGARSFSYSTSGDPNADAIDIEPGAASPSDFPAFYHAKGGKDVYAYGSASWISDINVSAQAAGIPLSAFKRVGAHYIGPHICGPATCGYPQCDATQFTDRYLGLSLDGTLLGPGFFGSVTPSNPWPLQLGSTGSNVVMLQGNLNKWKFATPPLAQPYDGQFGPLTKTAVQHALAHWNYSAAKVAAGVVDEDLWNDLKGPPVTPPPPATYGPPLGLSKKLVSRLATVTLTWSQPAAVPGLPPASEYAVYVYKGINPSAATSVPGFPVVVPVGTLDVTVPAGIIYTAHVVASGQNGSHVVPGVFAVLSFSV